MKDMLLFNIEAHDKIAYCYEKNHKEIFNKIEQERLRESLNRAIEVISTNTPYRALDFGCGSGNVTRHLINLGIHTTSADVSEEFLKIIQATFGFTGISETLKIDRKGIENVPNETFDLVSVYSVLHHIPDYLSSISEMIRVLKCGGVLYIDHEASDAFWNKTPEQMKMLKLMRPKKLTWKRLVNLLKPSWYLNRVRLVLNPRYQPEGDIHVWPDDHIEWDKIEILLTKNNFRIIYSENYLAYKEGDDLQVHNNLKNTFHDMKLLIAIKSVK